SHLQLALSIVYACFSYTARIHAIGFVYPRFEHTDPIFAQWLFKLKSRRFPLLVCKPKIIVVKHLVIL
ncbi:MAG: hypothetical protein KH149_07100, partial [Clostridiales bacterium]|nr:hypothetical protein [Clostridiales bacterium]